MPEPDFDLKASVRVGETADAYLSKGISILRNEGLNPTVVVEFYASHSGLLCGMKETLSLLSTILPEGSREVSAKEEGEMADANEAVLRIKAKYCDFGLYETAICGILAQSSGWATAAKRCVEAAQGTPILCFGARYVHPSVTGIMEYSAAVGGCVAVSSMQGSTLSGKIPAVTIPHALSLIMGDTTKAMQAFHKHMPQDVPRVALVSTFKDEAEESLDVARSLKEHLRGIRLDTLRERGNVTPELVKEVRARLDQAGFSHVEITVSGNMDPDRIRHFIEVAAPVDSFGVGRYIAGANPNFFVAELQEIEGRAVARRGRIPGISNNPQLKPVLWE